MKVAIFVDGKNFYMGLQKYTSGRRLDFSRLANWLVTQADGTRLVGCHYYTGVEAPAPDRPNPLAGFLAMLETQRGHFVHRFPRESQSIQCSECGATHSFTREKEVDTTMVADMLRMAAVDAFDALVLVSGDADHAPAVEGVRSLGKIAFVATWGGYGLSSRIRNASFDHIDLAKGLANFEAPQEEAEPPGEPSDADARVFLEQLRLAEAHFASGYVGVNHFLTRWKGDGLPPTADERQRLLDALLLERKLEIYLAGDGKKALRTVAP